MVRYYCDICKNRIKDSYYKVKIDSTSYGRDLYEGEYRNVCDDCAKAISKTINSLKISNTKEDE